MSRRILFFLFFVSGFCSLVYQLIWTRLAFAAFGIIAPVLSVVISVFMLGIALGSWAGGKWIEPLTLRARKSAIFFYGLAELMIGLGAFAVPASFTFGSRLLLTSGEMGSVRYLFFSAVVLGISILPWCFLMGTTFPFMLAYMRGLGETAATAFSYLYVPNVLGAMTGTLLSALVLVEMLGFKKTLLIAAVGNFLIGGAGIFAATRSPGRHSFTTRQDNETAAALVAERIGPGHPRAVDLSPQMILWILFATGFASLAMEVVWVRAFAPVVKTQVYSFALVLATYLGATLLGSLFYRRHSNRNVVQPASFILVLLCAAVFLPVLLNDVRLIHPNSEAVLDPSSVVILLSSIVPFCALLGYLTPRLVDAYAGGSPQRAGRSYAINVLGCIMGPLIASYALLPRVSERHASILLGLPLFALYLGCGGAKSGLSRRGAEFASIAALLASLFYSRNFEDSLRKSQSRFEVRRDYAATVISCGEQEGRRLLVNGIGMTALTPITKFMVHLPFALRKTPPHSALIICFGMGTSYRSALSWDVVTTCVELVPGVRDAFGFYHADAANYLSSPNGRIVIDDGRRYLLRTREKFDAIVLDPPPPVEAAGTSLLYSTEFYELARQHLNPGGILQAWIPLIGGPTAEAAYRSVRQSFPYVRCFISVGRRGRHLLASLDPIEVPNAAELAGRLPLKARIDLMEWNAGQDLQGYLRAALAREVPVNQLLNWDEAVRITDDLPYNEYFLLRGMK